MPYATLISTDALADHLDDPGWVVVDCRFDLADPVAGRRRYEAGHIPGAIYLALEYDLSDPKTETTGRHPLPDMAFFQQRLGQWGIGSGSQVVGYDDAGGAYAARLWWMLRYLGHEAAAVLDGGFPHWQREGRPSRGGIETRPAAHFSGEANPAWRAGLADVERLREAPDYRLVDSRDPDRFRGENETIDPVAGRIPGAANYFFMDNLAEDGTFLPAERLKSQLAAVVGDATPERTIFYCGSGVTACLNVLAMEHIGLKGSKLFVGSWSEWITDPDRPIATG